jgi:acetylornithine deacetylase
MKQELTQNAITLLKQLIATPSYSTEEHNTASLIEKWLSSYIIPFKRQHNNVIAYNKHFKPNKPTLLLNSHHDTVKPNDGYTINPFMPTIKDGKLYGLGSNDAGGALVSLLATFVYFYSKSNLPYNIVMVASGEEENSGEKGLKSTLTSLPEIDVAIVGEPTKMQLAIAEKGLVVFDAQVKGTPSHAAHENNNNAIYNTIETLQWFKDFEFPKASETLEKVKLTVTQINGGKQHNVVPSCVNLVVDVRVNDKYTNQEIADILIAKAPCQLTPRSLKLNSSSIPIEHSLVQAGIKLGKKVYGSPTLSDQSVLSCISLKMGPGDSTRSHAANEFIYVNEVEEGIHSYITILETFFKITTKL